jgi:hypothetical protein
LELAKASEFSDRLAKIEALLQELKLQETPAIRAFVSKWKETWKRMEPDTRLPEALRGELAPDLTRVEAAIKNALS